MPTILLLLLFFCSINLYGLQMEGERVICFAPETFYDRIPPLSQFSIEQNEPHNTPQEQRITIMFTHEEFQQYTCSSHFATDLQLFEGTCKEAQYKTTLNKLAHLNSVLEAEFNGILHRWDTLFLPKWPKNKVDDYEEICRKSKERGFDVAQQTEEIKGIVKYNTYIEGLNQKINGKFQEKYQPILKEWQDASRVHETLQARQWVLGKFKELGSFFAGLMAAWLIYVCKFALTNETIDAKQKIYAGVGAAGLGLLARGSYIISNKLQKKYTEMADDYNKIDGEHKEAKRDFITYCLMKDLNYVSYKDFVSGNTLVTEQNKNLVQVAIHSMIN